MIDLKQCITDVVGLIPRDVCARPNTFELRTVRRQLRGEADTLVTHCNNTLSTTRWGRIVECYLVNSRGRGSKTVLYLFFIDLVNQVQI